MDLQSLYNKIMDLLDQERAFIDCNEMKIYKIYEDGAYIEELSFNEAMKMQNIKNTRQYSAILGNNIDKGDSIKISDLILVIIKNGKNYYI